MEKRHMAKTTAALLSFAGSGQIAKTQVYASWRGIPYVRKYTVPANPNSTEQQKTRSAFADFSNIWKNAASLLQAPWTLFAQGQQFYNRNAYIGQNVKAVRGAANLNDWIASPGAKGGVAPTSVTPAGAHGAVTCTFVVPSPPTGWSITQAVVAAILDGNPGSLTDFITFTAFDASSPYAPVLALPAAGTYQIAGWLQWMKPDGSTAYSPSLSAPFVAS